MSVIVLIALLGAAFALQYALDAHRIVRLAADRRWSVPRITWTPRSLLRSRWERSYWLRYLDEDGRPERRLCRVTSVFGGPEDVWLEPVTTDRSPVVRAPRRQMGRLAGLVVCAAGGSFVGLALGIGGAFVLYPGSNIAPAYGVLLGAPAGLVSGVVLGLVRRVS